MTANETQGVREDLPYRNQFFDSGVKEIREKLPSVWGGTQIQVGKALSKIREIQVSEGGQEVTRFVSHAIKVSLIKATEVVNVFISLRELTADEIQVLRDNTYYAKEGAGLITAPFSVNISADREVMYPLYWIFHEVKGGSRVEYVGGLVRYVTINNCTALRTFVTPVDDFNRMLNSFRSSPRGPAVEFSGSELKRSIPNAWKKRRNAMSKIANQGFEDSSDQVGEELDENSHSQSSQVQK